MKYLLFAVAFSMLLSGCVVRTDPHHHHGRVEVREYHGHPHHRHHEVRTKETIKIKQKR